MTDALPATRKEALELGLKHYFTGIPCRRGHVAHRYVLGSRCAECSRIDSLKRSQLPHVKERNAHIARSKQYKERAKERRLCPVYQEKRREYRSRPDVRARKNESSRRNYNAEKARKYREDNRDRLNQYFKERYWKKRDEILEKSRKRAANLSEEQRERIRSYKKEWSAENRKTPDGKAINFMRKCLHRCLVAKQNRTSAHLGYKKSDLIRHIESTFKKGMTWDNYGDWHIDHILPIRWFLDEGVTDPKEINALSNLRAIWKKENLSKGPRRTHLI